MMNKYVLDNAEWLKKYEQNKELHKINHLEQIIRLKKSENTIKIIDVGCGNGRSIKTIKQVFPKSDILAIDRYSPNIEYICVNYPETKTLCADALDFFASDNGMIFDVVFFSWSFFDMLHIDNKEERTNKLEGFLENIKKHLSIEGIILVLQPTKGGNFEKLLSFFIEDSEEMYAYTHSFLISHDFKGPKTTFPDKNDELAIWSEFIYKKEEELFDGIASILFLETGKELLFNEYSQKVNLFRVTNKINNNLPLVLTDCVNIYLFQK